MVKALTELREHLEQVKNPFLFFIWVSLVYLVVAVLTLFGVYVYTRH